MEDGKINVVGSHLHETFRNSSLWNSRLWGDLGLFVFSVFLQFPCPSSCAPRKKYAPEYWESFCLKAKGRPYHCNLPPSSSL